MAELLKQLEHRGRRLRRRGAVHFGGPVEGGRGFVLHSADYVEQATLVIGTTLALTATLDILRAIGRGEGPRHSLLALGYAGWGPGQLDAEIQANGWLTVAADDAIVFDAEPRRQMGARARQARRQSLDAVGRRRPRLSSPQGRIERGPFLAQQAEQHMVLPAAVDAEIGAWRSLPRGSPISAAARGSARYAAGRPPRRGAGGARSKAKREDQPQPFAHVALAGMRLADPIAEAGGLGDAAADIGEADAAQERVVVAAEEQEAVALVAAPIERVAREAAAEGARGDSASLDQVGSHGVRKSREAPRSSAQARQSRRSGGRSTVRRPASRKGGGAVPNSRVQAQELERHPLAPRESVAAQARRRCVRYLERPDRAERGEGRRRRRAMRLATRIDRILVDRIDTPRPARPAIERPADRPAYASPAARSARSCLRATSGARP